MVDPKFNNNNHLIDDLKEEPENNDVEEGTVSSAISSFTNRNGADQILKEKLQKNLLILAVIVVIFVVVLFVLSLLTSGKKSYSAVEDIMVEAAEKYYKENDSLLPSTTGGTVEVSAKKLSNNNYMRDINKYMKNSSCSGKVVVENNDDTYIYVSYLDCGDDYKTTELYRKVTDTSNLVTTLSGLYSNNGEYIYKGDAVDNYVSIKDQLWRIVKVTKDNEVVLVKQDRSDSSSYPWDDRYNGQKKYSVGINNFTISRLNDTLKNIYADKDGLLFTKNIKGHIVNHNYCIGKRSLNQEGNNNNSECNLLSDSMKVGILTVGDYMNASLDGGCVNTTSQSCQNYNYLVNKEIDWWTITANSDSTYQAYYVSSRGVVTNSTTSSFKKIRPVIYLNSRTMFESGKGTLEKPYMIK